MRTEIKITDDGSSTLYVPELDEHYHSTNGAVQESEHVFIQTGLQHCQKQNIRLLEIGFGTGLNALLTLLHNNGDKDIVYDSLEKHPLKWELIEAMAYAKTLKLSDNDYDSFKKMHQSKWEDEITISEEFALCKKQISLIDFLPERQYDLIYFDAFAPNVQPELWEEEIFIKLYNGMNAGGILVTYCAKGEVRRRMQRSGFRVERLPGPPGKREILRATKE